MEKRKRYIIKFNDLYYKRWTSIGPQFTDKIEEASKMDANTAAGIIGSHFAFVGAQTEEYKE